MLVLIVDLLSLPLTFTSLFTLHSSLSASLFSCLSLRGALILAVIQTRAHFSCELSLPACTNKTLLLKCKLD